MLFVGLSLTLGLGVFAFAGDGSAKKASKRLEALRERHSGSREMLARAQMKRLIAQRDNKLDSVVGQFIPRPAELRARLERSGKSWTLGQYALACAGTFTGAALVLISAGAPPLLALLVGSFLGIGLPHAVVGFLIKRRVAAFTTRFPDAIDLLVRGLRSGLPVSESLGVVGKEIAEPVGSEFRIVADKIRIGRTMEVALHEMAARMNTPEFQFFVITLSIQRETGGNLAETLANLGEVLRKRAQMKLKINAMSSESKASAYIVGSLPFAVFGLVWMANKNYLMPFFEDQRLMIAGTIGFVWMSIGAFIMSKMVRFEI
ncbi:type II secretion system F family protein [Sphingoaurantiacus capsulatus]|uniref:Type II secretion system F family protein n=1 Tax=Sphingoaurantiacus capsulatus TaxID=1771310 RepID=A0ABV7XAA1_9SPHN